MCDWEWYSKSPFLFREAFSSSFSFRFSEFASCWYSRATCPGYGHFEEVYSQLQPYKSERHLGACLWTLLRHCAHPVSVLVGNAAERSLQWALAWSFPRGLSPKPDLCDKPSFPKPA